MLTSPDVHFPPPGFHVMAKPRGSICNLDCHYCFYLKKERLYPDGNFRMSDELLEQFTIQYINAQQIQEVVFAWQGGEPTLMRLDFFRKAVDLQAKHKKPGMRIQNSFQTNGTLLNDDWCEFFHKNNFLVGLSIDGPRHLHDTYRLDKGGLPTFDHVYHAAQLLKKHRVEFNTLTCVNAANADHGLGVYRFLRDEIGSRFMQYIPIVERDNETGNQAGKRVTHRSVNGPQYGSFLIDIFDEWVRHDVGRVNVQLFDVSLAAWAGQRPGLCIHEETCGLGLAMEFNGDVYSCDHFVEPKYYLGNIADQPLDALVKSSQQFTFGQDKKSNLPDYCRSCKVRFICNGGCPKDRLLITPANEPGLNYLCAGYQAFFNYIDRPMKWMAAYINTGQPPAEIMNLITSEPTLRETPPGATCPCGSQKPVEQCHKAPAGFVPPGHKVPPPSRIHHTRRRH
jgi:uncharacterized protein